MDTYPPQRRSSAYAVTMPNEPGRSGIDLAGRSIPAALIAGVPVDDVTLPESLDLIDAFVREGRRSGRSFQIATVNVDFVVNARADRSVLDILQRAELCLPDGMPILWCAKVAGTPLRERVPGADLVPRLVERSASNGSRVLLFGSAPGVAEAAAGRLRDMHPGADVHGLSGPFMNDVLHVDRELIEEIASLRADIICVALGNPKQERFIAAHRASLGASVLIGVGGTLDFIVGGRRRAPTAMQRAGLEWVYRAAQEPRRLGRRYLHDGVTFAPYLAKATATRVKSMTTTPHGSPTDSMGIRPNGATIDLTGRPRLDHVDVAHLVGLARDRRRHDSQLLLNGCSAASRNLLTALDVDGMFRFLDDGHLEPGDE
jgi:exopolysaccharide biosynthesis WecB/TagA/CpsF family protein